jgi:hypothetical protein
MFPIFCVSVWNCMVIYLQYCKIRLWWNSRVHEYFQFQVDFCLTQIYPDDYTVEYILLVFVIQITSQKSVYLRCTTLFYCFIFWLYYWKHKCIALSVSPVYVCIHYICWIFLALLSACPSYVCTYWSVILFCFRRICYCFYRFGWFVIFFRGYILL